MSETCTFENIRDFTLSHKLESQTLVFGEDSYTFGDLELMSRHISTWFTAMQLQGEPVAFMLPNGFEAVAVYLACFKTGAVAMPLSRNLSPGELRNILAESEAKCLIIELEKLSLIEEIDLKETFVQTVYINGVVPREGYNNFYTLLGPAGQYEKPVVNENDPALLLYGPTPEGGYKGTTHTFSSMQAIFESTSAALDDVKENDIMLVLDPQINISGFIETFTGLYYGAKIILHEKYKVEETIPALVNERVTLMITHVGVYERLLESMMTTKDTFGSVRGVYTGGKSISPELQKKFYDHTGHVINLGYGMTEAIWLTINKELNTAQSSIGKPLPGVNIRIIGTDGKNVSEGEVGEICVAGSMVTPGYWKNQELTAQRLQHGWFITGDLGYFEPNGNIVIVQN